MKSLDVDTLAKLKDGDQNAFEEIFNGYYPRLYNYASEILKDREKAQEIVEDAFINVWEYRSKIDIVTSLKSYLYRTVYNLCLNDFKHIQVEEKYKIYLSHHLTDSEDDADYPLAHLIKEDLENAVSVALNNLPDKCREIFLLSRFDQLSNEEIALKLDITVNTVRTQINRAIIKLKNNLSEYIPIISLMICMLK